MNLFLPVELGQGDKAGSFQSARLQLPGRRIDVERLSHREGPPPGADGGQGLLDVRPGQGGTGRIGPPSSRTWALLSPNSSARQRLKHSEANIEAIKGSLAAYGQRRPVVYLRKTGVVIAGNGLLQAALSLGKTHVAGVAVDDDAATAAGYSIADNRTSDLHAWDKEALEKLLRECSTANDERLDQMLADLAKQEGIVPGNGSEEPRPGDDPPPPAFGSQYGVIVVCRDEAHQREVYEKLAAEGHDCKVVVT